MLTWMMFLPLLLGIKHKLCHSFPGRGQSLLPLIVSVVGGADMSCLPSRLLCQPLPVKSLTQLRANEDQGDCSPLLDTKNPMAISKANPSYRADFMVDLVRLHR